MRSHLSAFLIVYLLAMQACTSPADREAVATHKVCGNPMFSSTARRPAVSALPLLRHERAQAFSFWSRATTLAG